MTASLRENTHVAVPPRIRPRWERAKRRQALSRRRRHLYLWRTMCTHLVSSKSVTWNRQYPHSVCFSLQVDFCVYRTSIVLLHNDKYLAPISWFWPATCSSPKMFFSLFFLRCPESMTTANCTFAFVAKRSAGEGASHWRRSRDLGEISLACEENPLQRVPSAGQSAFDNVLHFANAFAHLRLVFVGVVNLVRLGS